VSCVANAEMETQFRLIWHEFVDGLADESRLLDLATGNGFVALNCQTRALDRQIDLQVEAVDAADIKPKTLLNESSDHASKVNFQGGVQLENLPFEDQSFTAVVSQFGFEYADEEQAIPEISRVLVMNGQLRLIIHAQHGAISRDIHKRVQRLEAVLGKNGAVNLVLKLIRALAVGDEERVKQESKHIPTAITLTQYLADDPLADDSGLFYAKEFLQLWDKRNQSSPAELLHVAEQGWLSANGTLNRQRLMLQAARSDGDIKRIATLFETRGLMMRPPKKIFDLRRNIQNSWLVEGEKS
jgi:ubiquinone/menaquinone biosynthesis C-methylase UbiE